MSTPTGKPKKFAGHGPPDTDFYFSTFSSGQLNKQQLVRGLHIDNLLAREIDDFVDQQLRQDAPDIHNTANKAEPRGKVDEGSPEQSLTAVKLFQLEGGKKTDFALDGICTALIDEFACFGEALRKQHDIPWCWLVAVIHIWVRSNRTEMVRFPASRDELGGHKRRYLEKREKVQDEESTGTMKRKKKVVRLIDVKIVVRLYCRVASTPGGDSGDEGDGRVTIQMDSSESKIILPTFKLLADFDEIDGAYDTRYFDNGDIKPDALDYDKLVEECRKLCDVGEESILAYSVGSKVSKIRDNSTLAKAVKSLRRGDATADVFELMFVGG